jgi:hypothetical protein
VLGAKGGLSPPLVLVPQARDTLATAWTVSVLLAPTDRLSIVLFKTFIVTFELGTAMSTLHVVPAALFGTVAGESATALSFLFRLSALTLPTALVMQDVSRRRRVPDA